MHFLRLLLFGGRGPRAQVLMSALPWPGRLRFTAGTNGEAAALVGDDRETPQRDLFEAIGRHDYPKWRMGVQVMPEDDADKSAYNPFDLTEVWPRQDYPVIEVGVLELNRNPENYFAEVEQAAFSPANVVPGISQ